MPLFETLEVDNDLIERVAKEHWGVKVLKCLKSSQNHTFLVIDTEEKRFILRVTPDREKKRINHIQLELTLLDYLHNNELPVCRAIPSSIDRSTIVRSDPWILCLFEFATGIPVIYADWQWMTNREMIIALGRWFARLHRLTRQFVQDRPDVTALARNWTQIHDGALADFNVDERDLKTVSDPNCFGLIHGDVNSGNYYWDSILNSPCMFDWDELQTAWFLYDLSAPIWHVISLERAGSPIDRLPVPQANAEFYTNLLVEGYESIDPENKIDRDALQRMVMMRRELYRRLSRQVLIELPPSHPMIPFCKFMVEFFDREEKNNS